MPTGGGVKLGNPKGAGTLRRAGKGAVALSEAVTANAEWFAMGLAPVLQDVRAAGHVSLRAFAAELSRHGIRTRRGGVWQVLNARNLVERLSPGSP